MRILVVSQYFWPENFRINDLAQELIRRGHELTILTGVPNYPDGEIFPSFRQCQDSFSEFHSTQVIRVPMRPRHKGVINLLLNYISFMVSASTIGIWRLRKQAFDVIFVFGASPISVCIPAIVLRSLKRIPIVFWVLDLWPESLAAVGIVKSKKILDFIGLGVRYIYNRCDLILGQSKTFFDSISKYCDHKQKIRYFPSWAEDVFSADTIVDPAPEITELDGSFDIVFAGNIGEAQDFPAILRAAELLKDSPQPIRWLIVGDGRMAAWVNEQIRSRGLEQQVLMLGRFPVERMPSFYACADALLVSLKAAPAFSLTIPGKVQSYLISGIPVLGMLDGEGAKTIQDANAGLICAAGDSANLAAIALKMSKMTPSERKKLGENGRSYAHLEFERSRLFDNLESWFIEVVHDYQKK